MTLPVRAPHNRFLRLRSKSNYGGIITLQRRNGVSLLGMTQVLL